MSAESTQITAELHDILNDWRFMATTVSFVEERKYTEVTTFEDLHTLERHYQEAIENEKMMRLVALKALASEAKRTTTLREELLSAEAKRLRHCQISAYAWAVFRGECCDFEIESEIAAKSMQQTENVWLATTPHLLATTSSDRHLRFSPYTRLYISDKEIGIHLDDEVLLTGDLTIKLGAEVTGWDINHQTMEINQFPLPNGVVLPLSTILTNDPRDGFYTDKLEVKKYDPEYARLLGLDAITGYMELNPSHPLRQLLDSASIAM